MLRVCHMAHVCASYVMLIFANMWCPKVKPHKHGAQNFKNSDEN